MDIKNKHIEVVVRRMAELRMHSERLESVTRCDSCEEKCEIVKGTSNLPPGTTLLYSDLEALCALQPSGEERLWKPFGNEKILMKIDKTKVFLSPGGGSTVGHGAHESGPRQQPRAHGDGIPRGGQRPQQRRAQGHRRRMFLLLGSFSEVSKFIL